MVGVASWYGPRFDGKPTASGAIYDQEKLTAASPTLPIGSRVRVTNLENQRSIEVEINDRGPFVKGRKIDLSRRAAREIGMLETGTARVRIEILRLPPASRAIRAPLLYFVQVGSFLRVGNAERLRGRLSAWYRDAFIKESWHGDQRVYRVRMGGFKTRGQALRRASEAARLGFPSMILSE